MSVQFGDVQENINKISQMLEKEQPQPGTLVVLPELFLTGYSPEAIEDVARDAEETNLGQLLFLANKYKIKLFGSLPLLSGGEIYNTAILINDGQIISRYQKSHLFGPMGEKELFRAGREISVSHLGDLAVGTSVCYDLRFPELYRQQASHGAELLLICAEWPSTRINHWSTLLQARAIENQLTIIACNRVGDDPDYHYGGHSTIINSFGEELAAAAHDREMVIRYSLDETGLVSFRDKFNTAIDTWLQ